jgi:predicted nuclease of predicted toxin-antitoxin system
VKFLIDHQLPPSLTDFFREHGFDSEHVFEIGMATSTDASICEYASAQRSVIVSKDEDFLYLLRSPGCTARLL